MRKNDELDLPRKNDWMMEDWKAFEREAKA